MAENPIRNSTILGIFPAREDRRALAGIFAHSEWKVKFTKALREAKDMLRTSSAGVVISDAHLSDGHCWKDLLHDMERQEMPLPLIVADRLADAYLWAEVLNLGAFDLLAKPFDAKEVLHAVTAARRHFENNQLPGSRVLHAQSSFARGWS